MSRILDQVFFKARMQALPAGQRLFLTGDPVQSVFLVRAGRIALVRRNRESGAPLFLHIAGPGMMLAEASVLVIRPIIVMRRRSTMPKSR